MAFDPRAYAQQLLAQQQAMTVSAAAPAGPVPVAVDVYGTPLDPSAGLADSLPENTVSPVAPRPIAPPDAYAPSAYTYGQARPTYDPGQPQAPMAPPAQLQTPRVHVPRVRPVTLGPVDQSDAALRLHQHRNELLEQQRADVAKQQREAHARWLAQSSQWKA